MKCRIAKENLKTNCAAIPSCHLQHAEFQVAASCSELYVITGKYLVTTDPEEKFFLSAQQRCTFVWEKNSSGLQISHIHISNPIGELKIAEDEAFPDTMGKMASHYMKEEILRLTSDRKLSVCDVNGSLIFLQMSDVMFISALGKETVVRTLTDCIFAKNSIIATGGSAVYCTEAMEKYRENDIVVYIRLEYQELEKRLGNLKRRGVVLKDGQTLKDLYNERTPLYEKYAHIIVDSDNMSVEELMDAICSELHKIGTTI